MNYKQEAIKRFSKDIFASIVTGIIIEEVEVNYAKCSLSINGNHLNSAGFVMGGAIFTLADFAFAVAANCENELTVTLSCKIDYLSATKGPILIAEAKCLKTAKNICFYEIEVKDDKDKLVAKVSSTGYRKM